jgi:hypothetical protein
MTRENQRANHFRLLLFQITMTSTSSQQTLNASVRCWKSSLCDEPGRRLRPRAGLDLDRCVRESSGERLDLGALDAAGKRRERNDTADLAIERTPVLVTQ